MRHAVVLAGGAGTRLWPLSRAGEPKQLIPLAGGASLLEATLDRLTGLVDPQRCYVCAGEAHRAAVSRRVPWLPARQYLGEPERRDTLAAVCFAAAVVEHADPHGVLGVFTSDHFIRPAEAFRATVRRGYELAEARAETIVTFGVSPTHAATSFGYLELGSELEGGARRVSRFREKPDAETARGFLAAGPGRYLWNSGSFVFRAATVLDCLERYEPAMAEGIRRIGGSWGGEAQERVLAEVYPTLRRVSFDFGIMEPASLDPALRIAAFPLSLEWLDIGSWPAFASMFASDDRGNTVAAERHLLEGCSGSLLVSDDPTHLVAALGCDDLIVVHTERATLVCRKDRAEEIKKLHALVAERFGPPYL